MRGKIIAGAAVCLSAWLGAATACDATASRSDELDRLALAAVRTGIPGVVVAVRKSSTTRLIAVGHARRGGERMDGREAFRIGSITKSFTAVIVLQLVAEQRIGLDSTVESVLPG